MSSFSLLTQTNKGGGGGGGSSTQNNFSATTDPTSGDDAVDGYVVGSVWINITTKERWVCLDATAGSAVWEKSTTGTAQEIVFTPIGNIASTTVQDAIAEVDTEKLANIVEDTTPQLGGDLDPDGHTIGAINNLTDGVYTGDSVGLGNGALSSDDGSSNKNTAVGKEAMKNTTTGYYNIAQGYQALYTQTTGRNNVAQGYQALNKLTTGHDNVANGYKAGYKHTTGYNNVINGAEALYNNTYGNNNVANGYQALYANTHGNNNVAVGPKTLYMNTTGIQNVAVGSMVLYKNTTGQDNVGSGHFSLYANTTGTQNVASGTYSMSSSTTGTQNVALGYRAMNQNEDGSNNVAVGHKAGRHYGSGTSVAKHSNYSVFIGDTTRANADNETNQIVIGYDTLGHGSNTATIGNSSVTGNFFSGAVSHTPLSADPADPADGSSVQWVSDGTDTGDAGDVLMKINIGGTVKTITLIDYSSA